MKDLDVWHPSDETHERLRAIRDKHGVTWQGMLVQGAKQLVGTDIRRALTMADPDIDMEAFEAAFWMPDGDCCDDSPAEVDQSCDPTNDASSPHDRTKNARRSVQEDDRSEESASLSTNSSNYQ